MTLKVVLLSLALQIPLITMDWTCITCATPAPPTITGTIECDQPQTGQKGSSDLYFLFNNTVERDVSFSTCFSQLDTILRLYDADNVVGDGLQYWATNHCKGDQYKNDCHDKNVFSKCPAVTETFTMASLAVGEYVVKLGSNWDDAPYDLRVLCNVTAQLPGFNASGWWVGSTTPGSTVLSTGNLKDMGDPPSALLDACEGDCDSDAECEGDLVCWIDIHPDVPPGCTGEQRRLWYDYCGPADEPTTTSSPSTTKQRKDKKPKAKKEKATTFVFEVHGPVIAALCVAIAVLLAALLCIAKGANRERYAKVATQTDVETDDENAQLV